MGRLFCYVGETVQIMATHRRPDEDERSDWRDVLGRLISRLPDRLQRQSLGVFLVEVGIAVCLLVLAAVFLSTWGSGDSEGSTEPTTVALPLPAPSVAPAPATPLVGGPGVPVDTDVAPAPGMDPSLAPPDGPDPDQPPFGVDAVAMRNELRTHGVDLPDSKLQALVDMADKYIAQDDPDLDAWDSRIMADVKAMWPDLDKNHVIDVTRCTAEYIERVIARNHGWAHPPDEDDHGVAVDGHGSAPRVTTVVPGGEAKEGN